MPQASRSGAPTRHNYLGWRGVPLQAQALRGVRSQSAGRLDLPLLGDCGHHLLVGLRMRQIDCVAGHRDGRSLQAELLPVGS